MKKGILFEFEQKLSISIRTKSADSAKKKTLPGIAQKV
jgi:hypothetical protein